MDELTRLECLHLLRDCRAKLAPLDERRKEEFLLACKEGRKPYVVQPLTEVRVDLLRLLIETIGGNIPDKRAGVMTLRAVIRDQYQACKQLPGESFAIYSDHLAAIIEAAGIQEESVIAQV